MGTTGNTQNPWAPYESYRDCSQGICSIYCPQWCYVVFPPPPPFELQDDDDSGTTFSPLIIAIISILASAFLLVSYYTIITKYCRRRRSRSDQTANFEANHDGITHNNQYQAAVTGLDETLIKSITVCKYIKGDGLIEGTECAVCLSEFQENESLRLLPKCTHAFHLPCIDTWLKTHSNCPLCRSSATPSSPPLPATDQAPSLQTSSTLNISSLEIQRQNDIILVVDDCERSHLEEVVVNLVTDSLPKDHFQDNRTMANGTDQESLKHFRRSISLGAFSPERHLSIADILRTGEDDDFQGRINQSLVGIGSSQDSISEQSKSGESRGFLQIKRSVSTGRFIDNKGKSSVTSN